MQYWPPPLTNIDEDQLLIKYADLISREVRRYCILASVNMTAHMDDLKSEAAMAFLICCRSFPVQSMDLNPLECKMCINKMRSAMRVCYWKIMNMGGNNNKAIDLNRSITFTDICSIHGDSEEESDIDSVLGLGEEDDYSSVIVSDFLKRLKPLDQMILQMRMNKDTFDEIEDVVHIKRRNLSKHFNIMRRKLIPIFQEMGYAI